MDSGNVLLRPPEAIGQNLPHEQYAVTPLLFDAILGLVFPQELQVRTAAERMAA